jgi:hypothetical protein
MSRLWDPSKAAWLYPFRVRYSPKLVACMIADRFMNVHRGFTTLHRIDFYGRCFGRA